MDVRLTSEQQQLRDAAAKLADDLGPDRSPISTTRAESRGWTSRSRPPAGVRCAPTRPPGWRSRIVAEEFGRGLVDVPFLGPVLADDLVRHLGADPVTRRPSSSTGGDRRPRASAAHCCSTAPRFCAADLGDARGGVDLTRRRAAVSVSRPTLGEHRPTSRGPVACAGLVVTTADLVGISRGALALATDYAKIREQYGKTIGSYQAVAHLLAESLALIEGSVSVLRHAAWAVDELAPAEAIRAAQIAKVYCARAARTVCETSIQVHGGIGNTWECLAHVYLRRALTSTELVARQAGGDRSWTFVTRRTRRRSGSGCAAGFPSTPRSFRPPVTSTGPRRGSGTARCIRAGSSACPGHASIGGQDLRAGLRRHPRRGAGPRTAPRPGRAWATWSSGWATTAARNCSSGSCPA